MANDALEEHFKKSDPRITLFPDGSSIAFDNLNHFQEFIEKENEFWSSCKQGLPNQIRSHFQNISNYLHTALSQTNINQAIGAVNSALSQAKTTQWPAIYSATPKAIFVRDMYNQNPTFGEAACQYLFQNSTQNAASRLHLEGYFRSFVAFGSDNSFAEAVGNRNAALAELRSRYAEELNTLHADYLRKHAECRVRDTERESAFAGFREGIEKWQDGMKQWEVTINGSVNGFLKQSGDKVEELEKLYREKLRLESPAQYWDGMAKDYEKRGKRWRTWALSSSVLLILFLTAVLYSLPPALVPVGKEGFNSLKATILLALIASMGIFIIRLFVKLSTSAYHLSRDANERYQLTHVYLSLLQEGAAKEEERNIVLQSIFSRADTGLLKGDSSPTFPDTILTNVLKNIKH
jgi:hypothetical protein